MNDAQVYIEQKKFAIRCNTAQNTEISPKFVETTQIVENSAETVNFHKISKPWN